MGLVGRVGVNILDWLNELFFGFCVDVVWRRCFDGDQNRVGRLERYADVWLGEVCGGFGVVVVLVVVEVETHSRLIGGPWMMIAGPKKRVPVLQRWGPFCAPGGLFRFHDDFEGPEHAQRLWRGRLKGLHLVKWKHC